jgi:hypothetical protein
VLVAVDDIDDEDDTVDNFIICKDENKGLG